MQITKQKQTHRYREQTSASQWGEKRGVVWNIYANTTCVHHWQPAGEVK